MGQLKESGPGPGPPAAGQPPSARTKEMASPPGRPTEEGGSAAPHIHRPRGEPEAACGDSTTGRQLRLDTSEENDSKTGTDRISAGKPDNELHQPMSAKATWGDMVRSHLPTTAAISEDAAPASHMLAGVWNPIQAKQLLGTLMTDWTQATTRHWCPEESQMRQEALAPAKASCDESIRAWTQRESEILQAYLAGSLDLPHPPNFLKEVLIGEHRAMIEDMHEAYFHATLTAVIPATVRLAKNAAHATIFRELFHANTDKNTGHEMMSAFQRDVKRLRFDGIQTLDVVFYSRTAADRWTEKTIRLQKAVITLRDTQRSNADDGTGHYTVAQLELQYAIRVYGGERLGRTALARIFAQLAGVKVLDVEYARATRTNIYDNTYHTIRFAQRTCPTSLEGVTRIGMERHEITLHHYQRYLRRPCARC
ncbi:hypothetical protein PF003_g8831 [Phytophthora fragariae]|nr:hypothetical protein PF003_g8831 [Phytophthora fragariae]